MSEFAQSPHRLVEFLTAVSAHENAFEARETAAQRAAEEFDAEIGAIIANGRVEAAVGFGADGTPAAALLSLAPGDRHVELPGLGRCHVATASWEAAERGLLVVARVDGAFTPEDRNLLLGMARGVGLTFRMIDALTIEHERRRLVEVVLEIQRAISRRKPLDQVLEEVTAAAGSLLGGRGVSLVLRDDVDVEGAPVHIDGEPAGALIADQAAGPLSATDRALLATFAEQASMALTDARLMEVINQARHDAVTGLPNRVLFLERLTRALEDPAANLAVLFIDLDRFKSVNDTLGHAAGDELLRAVAERISRAVRSADTAARFGGDEFAVLIEDAETPRVAGIAERIIATLRRAFRIGGSTVFIGATVGVAYGGTGDEAEALLRQADLAMYRGKNAGGGRVESYEPSMHADLVDRVTLECDLQSALPNDELELEYQPVVDLATGAPIGLEALLRWRHPRRGTVSPGDFIPVAEETGSIVPIGRWVLREACTRLAEWRKDHPDLRISVNVSASQLRDSDFPADLEAALTASGLPAAALTLELTESVLIAERGGERLARLKALGLRLAVDDFGTGYSSLRYLQRLPVDVLKIDRSFVAALPGTPHDHALARMIVELGTTMQLTTVAEGIETDDQLRTVAAMGCTLGQGFHLSRPVASDRVSAVLRAIRDGRSRARTGDLLLVRSFGR
jgi:diguanylate cyclase (GGDEF)-like protein